MPDVPPAAHPPVAESIARVIETHLGSLPWYVIAVVGAQFLIRAIVTAFGALHENHGYYDGTWRSFGKHWKRALKGWFPEDYEGKRSDLTLPFWVGLLELLVYPLLLTAPEGTTIIGAWIGFKTIAQWKRWTDDRVRFQRYFLGNALVIIASGVIWALFLRH